jgi:predicted SAM-dependent methyltransferase
MIALQKNEHESRLATVGARSKRVLNAGSGPKSIRKLDAIFDPAAWQEIRIDLDPGVDPDFVGSMTDMRTHFFERSFDAIWSSHSLEHLHTHEIPHALAEFRRILRDDGFALISCPDLETVMTLFLEHGSDHVIYHSAAGPITPLDMMFGHTPSIASGNLHMAHHSGLTAERLGGLLLQAGFAEAVTKRQNFDLWALALTEDADRDTILNGLQKAGLDMSDRLE